MQRQATAYHEAGHAVVAYHLGVEIEHVTVVPDHFSLGHFTHGDLFCALGRGSDRANLERAIKILLGRSLNSGFVAGRIAAEMDARTTIVPLASRAISPVQRASANSFATKSGARRRLLITFGAILSASLGRCLSAMSLAAPKSRT